VIAAVPVFASVNDWVVDAPTATDPKLRLAGEIRRYDCTPTPASGTVSGSAVAELAIDTVPLRAPVFVGRKLTCRLQLAPAASVLPAAGQVPLATLNSPVAVTAPNVTAPTPVLLTDTLCIALAPTSTEPKVSDTGANVSWGSPATPTSETNSSGVPAFDEISNAPARVPAPVPASEVFSGANDTVTVQLAPATSIEQLFVCE
jgi:hypothetical protein